MCSNGVAYLNIFFLVLKDISRYMKVYQYFTILFANCVKDWEAITVITVHEFLLCNNTRKSSHRKIDNEMEFSTLLASTK